MDTLYYGDSLDILRRYLKDETVGLVCLDPPFNSAANHNAFFQKKYGTATVQIAAFDDTWSWNVDAEKTYSEMTTQRDEVMQNFQSNLG